MIFTILLCTSWSAEKVTAYGTIITGVAACVAVFFGYFTMHHQVKKTAKVDWLKTFREEVSKLIALSLSISTHTQLDDLKEFNKTGTLLMFMLDEESPLHHKSLQEIINFIVFVMNNYQNVDIMEAELRPRTDSLIEETKQLIRNEDKSLLGGS